MHEMNDWLEKLGMAERGRTLPKEGGAGSDYRGSEGFPNAAFTSGLAEEALRHSEARFRELADNISQFAWTADQNGTTGTTSAGTTIPARSSKIWRGGAGRRCTIPTMSTAWCSGSRRASRP